MVPPNEACVLCADPLGMKAHPPAPPFAFGSAAPHALVDAVLERVLEALGTNGALDAHALGGLHAAAVGGKELCGVHASALRVQHPHVLVGVVVHACLQMCGPRRPGLPCSRATASSGNLRAH